MSSLLGNVLVRANILCSSFQKIEKQLHVSFNRTLSRESNIKFALTYWLISCLLWENRAVDLSPSTRSVSCSSSFTPGNETHLLPFSFYNSSQCYLRPPSSPLPFWCSSVTEQKEICAKHYNHQWPIQTLSYGGPGFHLLALLTFLPSVISSFFTQNKGAPTPPLDPSMTTTKNKLDMVQGTVKRL